MSHDGFLGLCFLPLTAIKKKRAKKGKKSQLLGQQTLTFTRKLFLFAPQVPKPIARKKIFLIGAGLLLFPDEKFDCCYFAGALFLMLK